MYVIVTLPCESVVPLRESTLPAVIVHVIVLSASGVPPDVRVAVSAVVPLDNTLKFDGETSKLVEGRIALLP